MWCVEVQRKYLNFEEEGVRRSEGQGRKAEGAVDIAAEARVLAECVEAPRGVLRARNVLQDRLVKRYNASQ